MTQECYHSAEISVNGKLAGPGLACTRKAGHSGECSMEVTGFTSHEDKRVATVLKVHWPSRKMLRRKMNNVPTEPHSGESSSKE